MRALLSFTLDQKKVWSGLMFRPLQVGGELQAQKWDKPSGGPATTANSQLKKMLQCPITKVPTVPSHAYCASQIWSNMLFCWIDDLANKHHMLPIA